MTERLAQPCYNRAVKLLSVLLLTGVVFAQNLDQKIGQSLSAVPGTVSLYAKNLDTGAAYGLREDEKVRTASTIKLPIMVHVFAQVAAGKARWDETLVLRDDDKVSGSGVIREMSDGLKLPVRDLTNLMIVVSDNSATNLLLDRFTADAVNAEMDKLGLRQTRSLRKVRGDGNQLKAPSGWSQAGRDPANQKYGLGVSTSREMVLLLEKLANGQVVSKEASQQMLDVLKRQQLKTGIGRHLPDESVASKSGSLDRLRSDVGIVTTKTGRIAIAITVDDLPATDYSPDNSGEKLISDLAVILLEGLSR
jgi:beta-lactamase class A